MAAGRDALNFPQASRGFLDPYLPPAPPAAFSSTSGHPQARRPHVTLTFAQSLDSAIALRAGVQTVLSGPESKAMTHYLRSRHDAILIGVGTAVVDDPSLNCRLEGSGGYGGEGLIGQPRPVVVDPRGRWIIGEGAKVLDLAARGRGKAPWVITADQPSSEVAQALNEVGGDHIVLDPDNDMRLSWNDVLDALARRGVGSVMIEGGAVVINSLLARPELVDSVIITLAPVWLGPGSVAVTPVHHRLQQPMWQQLGNDVVLCGRLDEASPTK